jgi:hypothetical protein
MPDISTAGSNVSTQNSFRESSSGKASDPPLWSDAVSPDPTTGEKLSRDTTTAEQLKSTQSPLDNLLSDAGELVEGATETVADVAADAYEGLKTLNQEYALAQRGMGALKTLGGLGEAFIGSVGIVAPEPATTMGGSVIFAHGTDVAWSGIQEMWYGKSVETLTDQAVTEGAKLLGADEATAKRLGDNTDLSLSLGTAGVGVYQVLTRPAVTQLEPIIVRPQARQATAAENNASSITNSAAKEARGADSVSKLQAGDVGPANSVSMRVGANALNSRGFITGDAGELRNKLAAANRGDIDALGEINAAKALKAKGINVHFRKAAGDQGIHKVRTADFFVGGEKGTGIGGQIYDVFSPSSSNAGRVVSQTAKKLSQTDRIVLNLDNTTLTVDDLSNIIHRVNNILEISRPLQEVIFVQNKMIVGRAVNQTNR